MKAGNVLLAGATGYLGRYIAHELLQQGYVCKLLVRDAKKSKFDPKLFNLVEAQVTQPATLKNAFVGIDVVISTVGITKQKEGLSYMDVDYQSNMNLLEAAKSNGIKKFIYVSAFGADKLTHLKICEAKEKFVAQLKTSGIDYCIIRPNGFFSDMVEFLKMAEKGTIYLFGKGNFKMNPIHGADLAKVCVEAITVGEKAISIGGPDIFKHKNMANLAFNVIDKPPKIKYISEWLRKLILWIVRTFTSSKTYGPIEFFLTVLAMDMIAPKYGKHSLANFYKEQMEKK